MIRISCPSSIKLFFWGSLLCSLATAQQTVFCSTFGCAALNQTSVANASAVACTNNTCTAAQCCTTTPAAGVFCNTFTGCAALNQTLVVNSSTVACTNNNCTAIQCCTTEKVFCNTFAGCAALNQTLATNSSTVPCTDNTCTAAQCCITAQPQNCVGAFANGTCSATCGAGTMLQTFIVSILPANGGANCTFANGTTQTVACSAAAPCAATCASFAECSAAANLTLVANASNVQCLNGTCTSAQCCGPAQPVNCVGGFMNGTCSVTCGQGTMVQTYLVSALPAFGGAKCPFENGTTKSLPCQIVPCVLTSACSVFQECKLCNLYAQTPCGWCPTGGFNGSQAASATVGECMPQNAQGNVTCSTQITTNISQCPAGPAVVNSSTADVRTMIANLFGVDPRVPPDTLNASAAAALVNKIKSLGTETLASDGRFQQFVNIAGGVPTTPIQRPNGAGPAMAITNFGTGVAAAVVVSVNATNALTELNTVIPTAIPAFTAPPQWVSDVLTISRYDANGNPITNVPIQFNIQCTAPTAFSICRFSSTSMGACSAILNATNGGIIAAPGLSGYCTVTSNSTSSFAAFTIVGAGNCAGFTGCPSGTTLVQNAGSVPCAATVCTTGECCKASSATSRRMHAPLGLALSLLLTLGMVFALNIL